MTKVDVSERNHVANVCIFVEKEITRLKWFLILKHGTPLSEMPLDDIVIACSALCQYVICCHFCVNKNIRFSLFALIKTVVETTRW